MLAKLKSRKFWFALVGALLPLLAQYFTGEVGWSEAVMSTTAVLMSYIFGQGYVDAAAAQVESSSDG